LYPIQENQVEKIQVQKNIKLQPFTKKSFKLIMIYVSLVIMWMTSSIHSLSIPMISVLFMVLLFLLGIEILEWKKTIKDINWGIPILFASGLSIAKAFKNSGLLDIVSSLISNFSKNNNTFLVTIFIVTFLILVRLLFSNFNISVATFLPVI